MKRKMILLVVAMCLVFGVVGIAVAANPIKIVVNGNQISSDVAPFTQKGRTMVPLRVVSEALGADVQWDSNKNAVYITSKKINKTNADALLLVESKNGNNKEVESLLLVGANPNAITNRGKDMVNSTALILAAESGKVDVVKTLLLYDADPNLGDELNNTPLMISAIYGHADIVEILINVGAKVNSKNLLGNTPLIMASTLGETNVVKVLLINGADPSATNNNGETAADVAEKNKKWDTLDLLNSWN